VLGHHLVPWVEITIAIWPGYVTFAVRFGDAVMSTVGYSLDEAGPLS
jgi:hypothetical protein